MHCNKITEDQLIGYFLQTLQHDAREHLKAHLGLCHMCRKKLADLEKIKGLLQQWKPVTPPSDIKQKVLENVKAQELIEEKISQASLLEEISLEKIVEWLKQRVKSEPVRIYKLLTDVLGRKKGEEAFEYYLEEDLKQQMAAPGKDLFSDFEAFAKALGLDMEIKVTEDGAMEQTVRNCSYFTMAEELGLKVNPCKTICFKEAKIREKFQPIKVTLIKKMPNKDNECIFLYAPLQLKPT